MMCRSKKRAFTVVEVVLTIILIGILSSISAKVLVSGLDVYAFVANRKDILQNARVGMDRMVSELTTITSSSITSIADSNLGFTDRSFQPTSFKSVNNFGQLQLYRGDDFLAGSVSLLDFDYYGSTGLPTLMPLEVRRINIEFTTQAAGGDAGSVVLRTEVFPRCFMYTNFQ